MKLCSAMTLSVGLALVAVAGALRAQEGVPRLAPTSSRASSNSSRQLAISVLRGKIVCLSEEMHRLHGTELPSQHAHQWTLRATNGWYYTILPGRQAEAIFQDERIRTKDLEVRAVILPQTQTMEIQSLRSVRNGVVHDLYYYCNVCAIQSVSPEICACCQGPVELVEKPLKDSE